jgi:hypothetical protein
MSSCSGPGAMMARLWPQVEACCIAHDEAYTIGGDARLRRVADAEFLL